MKNDNVSQCFCFKTLRRSTLAADPRSAFLFMKQEYFIGTYTQGGLHFPHEHVPSSRGIYRTAFDPATDVFDELEFAAETPNPSYLARHPRLPVLYAVNECPIEGFSGGGLSVFDVDGKGNLEFQGRFDTLGQAPCHVAVDPGGRFLVVSNYRDGKFALFRLDDKGVPRDVPAVFQPQGHGPHLGRQQGAHAHFAAVDPRTENLLMVDLGTDTIYVRKYDESRHAFSEDPKSDLHVAPGSGPRHLVFSPGAETLYVIGELDSTIAVFVRNDDERFEGPIQTISTLPPETTERTGTAAAIVLHPSGKYLYASNRGTGIVSVFRRESNGRLAFRSALNASCKIPRFCCATPGGSHLIVCGQDSATLEAFRIDPESGQLTTSGNKRLLDSPVCLIPAFD